MPGRLAVLRLLLEHKANLDQQNDTQYTALMSAAEDGNNSCVAVLLGANANTALVDSEGRNALQIAKAHGHKNTVCLLKPYTAVALASEQSADPEPSGMTDTLPDCFNTEAAAPAAAPGITPASPNVRTASSDAVPLPAEPPADSASSSAGGGEAAEATEAVDDPHTTRAESMLGRAKEELSPESFGSFLQIVVELQAMAKLQFLGDDKQVHALAAAGERLQALVSEHDGLMEQFLEVVPASLLPFLTDGRRHHKACATVEADGAPITAASASHDPDELTRAAVIGGVSAQALGLTHPRGMGDHLADLEAVIAHALVLGAAGSRLHILTQADVPVGDEDALSVAIATRADHEKQLHVSAPGRIFAVPVGGITLS